MIEIRSERETHEQRNEWMIQELIRIIRRFNESVEKLEREARRIEIERSERYYTADHGPLMSPRLNK